MPHNMSTVLQRAGGAPALAAALKVSHQIVYIWVKRGWVPLARAVQIEKKYGVPRDKIIKPQLAELLSC